MEAIVLMIFSSIETNHLGAALLTFGLLPAIRRTAAKATEENLIPRIVIVASDGKFLECLI